MCGVEIKMEAFENKTRMKTATEEGDIAIEAVFLLRLGVRG